METKERTEEEFLKSLDAENTDNRYECQGALREARLKTPASYWQSTPCSAELLREQSRKLTELVNKDKKSGKR